LLSAYLIQLVILMTLFLRHYGLRAIYGDENLLLFPLILVHSGYGVCTPIEGSLSHDKFGVHPQLHSKILMKDHTILRELKLCWLAHDGYMLTELDIVLRKISLSGSLRRESH
jgi:hypothetical protein